MGRTRVWGRALSNFRVAASCLALLSFLFTSVSPALAGTTGVLSGTVTNVSSKAPIAGVTVVAKAATGSYNAVTDAHGFYSIAGVYADTYAVSFAKTGYQSRDILGVNVFADQSQTVNVAISKSLKTIAHVSTAASSSDFNPNQTTDTYTVTKSQIQNLQGSDLNISESNLLTSLPGVSYDSSGYPVIHGGRENEEGFEFEGIPYTDAFTNQFVNTLALPGAGISSAQLTPGAGDASVGSNGTGVINLVAQRGTNPGYANGELRIGGPGFDHVLNTSVSYASANGHVSEYAAFSGGTNSPVYGNNKYTAAQIGRYFSTAPESDRELINNLIFRFGRNNNQSVQLFADVAQHNFFQDYGGLGGGLCFASCNPFMQNFYGPIFGFNNAQLAGLSGLYPGQSFGSQTLAQASNRAAQTYRQPNQSYKIAYTLNIDPSTYLSVDAYSVNSVVTFDFPAGGTNALGLGDFYLQQGGHSTGGEIKLQKQLNEKNLVEAGYNYAYLNGEFGFNSQGYGLLTALIYDPLTLYDFISPTDPNCPSAGFGYPCGYAYGAFANPPAQIPYPQFNEISPATRRDQSFYLTDKVNFSDNLTAHLGFRVENTKYLGLPVQGLLPDCTFLYNPASAPANPNYNPANPAVTGNCPFLPTFTNITKQMTNPTVFEPRLGVSLKTGPNTAIRATYSRAAVMPILGLVDFNVVSPLQYAPYNKLAAEPGQLCGQTGYGVPCSGYGQQLYWEAQNFGGVAYQPFLPMTSNNYEITLSHQFTKGALRGLSASISPWLRYQYNTEASVSQPLLGTNGQPLIINGVLQTGPAVATNLGKEFGNGIDAQITMNPNRPISGQLELSYVNEFSSVLPTSGSEDFFPSIPLSSALAGNQYRVGFLSPLTAAMGLTFKTKSGWRINPRFQYDIGYPVGTGMLTSNFVNGVAQNVSNTNTLTGGAAYSEGIGPNFYVDPLNPGSVLNPNIIASRGSNETSSPGGKLTPPEVFANITVDYTPPKAAYTVGFDMENIFNRIYSGPFFNGLYQPVATGLSGPLTGASYVPTAYTVPYANPQSLPQFGGQSVFENVPNGVGRSFYFYVSTKV